MLGAVLRVRSFIEHSRWLHSRRKASDVCWAHLDERISRNRFEFHSRNEFFTTNAEVLSKYYRSDPFKNTLFQNIPYSSDLSKSTFASPTRDTFHDTGATFQSREHSILNSSFQVGFTQIYRSEWHEERSFLDMNWMECYLIMKFPFLVMFPKLKRFWSCSETLDLISISVEVENNFQVNTEKFSRHMYAIVQ